jgi:hypothetical protein
MQNLSSRSKVSLRRFYESFTSKKPSKLYVRDTCTHLAFTMVLTHLALGFNSHAPCLGFFRASSKRNSLHHGFKDWAHLSWHNSLVLCSRFPKASSTRRSLNMFVPQLWRLSTSGRLHRVCATALEIEHIGWGFNIPSLDLRCFPCSTTSWDFVRFFLASVYSHAVATALGSGLLTLQQVGASDIAAHWSFFQTEFANIAAPCNFLHDELLACRV